jgi:hypothetical protein
MLKALFISFHPPRDHTFIGRESKHKDINRKKKTGREPRVEFFYPPRDHIFSQEEGIFFLIFI